VDVGAEIGGNALHGTAFISSAMKRCRCFSFSDTKRETGINNTVFPLASIYKRPLIFLHNLREERFTIGLPGRGTEPSAGISGSRLDVLDHPAASTGICSVAPNPVTTALIGHLCRYAVNGLQHPTTIPARIPEYGYSYNGLAKVDFKSRRERLFRPLFHRLGNQVAPVGSQVKDYYEVGPIHVPYAASLKSHLTPQTIEQLLAGVKLFRQVFTDFNTASIWLAMD